MEEETTKNCPFCGEEVKAEAKKCKHCQENIADKICPFCGEEIKAIAKKCRHCKSNLETISVNQAKIEEQGGMIGFAVTSLIFGILGLCAAIDAHPRISDTEAGTIFLCFIINLIFGIMALVQKRDGKGMAIAGIVLAILSVLLSPAPSSF